ncbi:uncharacterized protein LOC116115894 isoform X1 [Pistacia vera]|uniref:uncharacterized protein LOC116115894 isoform X1 n=2 Tax=Pistacia vera TaxID=55513 RepID=UPI0012635114|nr:uncharacterized protein LOC116115894 isoform X1 [Pistacia vera]
MAANNDELDEKAKPPVIQQKGRFKVTSENVYLEKVAPSPTLQKSHSLQVLTQHPALTTLSTPSDVMQPSLSGNSLFPLLNSVLQTNLLQRESILGLMKQISVGDSTANRAVDGSGTSTNMASGERSLLEASHEREKELLHEITELQWRLICAQDELQKYKTENAQVNL